MFKLKKESIFALTLLLGWLLLSTAPIEAQEPLTPDQMQTLQSLHKIDPFPLYEMHYVGDYGLAAILKQGEPIQTGQRPTLLESEPLWACTVFAALSGNGDKILGRNFDWHKHPALILFTAPPDGYASASMVDVSYLGLTRDDSSWTANAGALLHTPYLPFDGMNEQGLAVGMMAVSQADGGNDPQKMTLNSLLMIRVLLDYTKNVDEALAMIEKYNIDFQGGPLLHYLIADASGKSAVVEFLPGERKVLPNEDPWQVATNFIIAPVPPADRAAQCRRYAQVDARLSEIGGRLHPIEAMPLLQSVAQDRTIWSAVYNLTTGDIQIAMGQAYQNIHQFSLKKGACDQIE